MGDVHNGSDWRRHKTYNVDDTAPEEEDESQPNSLRSQMKTSSSYTDSNYILAYQYENTHSRAN